MVKILKINCKKYLYILLLILLLMSCATFSKPEIVPAFKPIPSEYVTVRMYNGNMTAYIETTEFSAQIFAQNDFFAEDGTLTLFVGLQNNLTNEYIPIRYNNSQLSLHV